MSKGLFEKKELRASRILWRPSDLTEYYISSVYFFLANIFIWFFIFSLYAKFKMCLVDNTPHILGILAGESGYWAQRKEKAIPEREKGRKKL